MKIHIVQKGDTLFEIAENYQVNFEDIVKLNPQLSSPDMIMPGMKIKIPSESKQVNKDKVMKSPDKAVRVEQKESREAKTAERPMKEIKEDDRVEQKQIQIKVPESYEPLYPVKPIVQSPPPMAKPIEVREKKKANKTEAKREENMETQIEKENKVQEEPLPQTPYRPMKESAYNIEKPMVHYCCQCGRPVNMPRQQCYPSPWHRKGTYFTENPFMSPQMNHMQHYGMNYVPTNRHGPNYMQDMNPSYNYQMQQMPNENMYHGNNYKY